MRRMVLIWPPVPAGHVPIILAGLADQSLLIAIAGPGGTRYRALETIRQGYQTNMWGMPTYYLLRSGAHTSARSRCMSSRVSASSAANGSSISSTDGL